MSTSLMPNSTNFALTSSNQPSKSSNLVSAALFFTSLKVARPNSIFGFLLCQLFAHLTLIGCDRRSSWPPPPVSELDEAVEGSVFFLGQSSRPVGIRTGRKLHDTLVYPQVLLQYRLGDIELAARPRCPHVGWWGLLISSNFALFLVKLGHGEEVNQIYSRCNFGTDRSRIVVVVDDLL